MANCVMRPPHGITKLRWRMQFVPETATLKARSSCEPFLLFAMPDVGDRTVQAKGSQVSVAATDRAEGRAAARARQRLNSERLSSGDSDVCYQRW
jgi:hypothetical protein